MRVTNILFPFQCMLFGQYPKKHPPALIRCHVLTPFLFSHHAFVFHWIFILNSVEASSDT